MKLLLLTLFIPLVWAQEIIKKDYESKDITLKFIRAFPGDISDEHFNLVLPSSREIEIVCASTYKHLSDHFKNESYVTYNNFYNYYPTKFHLNDKKCRSFVTYLLKVFHAVDEENPIYLTFNLKKKIISKIQYPDINPYSQKGDIKDLLPKKPIPFPIPRKKKKDKLKKQAPPKEEMIPLFG